MAGSPDSRTLGTEENKVKTRIDEVSAGNLEGLAQCHHIRRVVFCVEQGVPEEIEWDDLDAQCRHYLLFVDDAPVATARVRPYKPQVMKIERVAALKTHRGLGLGRVLMDRILADLKAGPTSEVVLNAQTAVRDFYSALGFVTHGDEFFEADISHVHMRLKLR